MRGGGGEPERGAGARTLRASTAQGCRAGGRTAPGCYKDFGCKMAQFPAHAMPRQPEKWAEGLAQPQFADKESGSVTGPAAPEPRKVCVSLRLFHLCSAERLTPLRPPEEPTLRTRLGVAA